MKNPRPQYLMALSGHVLRTLTGMYDIPFGRIWDEALQQLLDEGELVSASGFRATFIHKDDTIDVWIANRWYAFGACAYIDGPPTGYHNWTRPRFRTMYRLYQKVQDWRAKEGIQ
ncbi:hypothetical protein [Escherichia coli]|uniref:hypothetical protein n=1 Tax=Escherichia coli TaxID=562 RepID=UPI00135D8E8A|nr:hypothetical protein [Escherichia coli]MXF04518.1 hypothetical protein [Escherichia coli]